MAYALREHSGPWVIWVWAALLLTSCLGRPTDTSAERRDADPMDAKRGHNAQLMGRHDWARFYFTRELERRPDEPASLFGLALAQTSGPEASLSTGAATLKRYLALKPDDAGARVRLARVLFWLSRHEEALAELDRLTGDVPPETQLLRSEILLDHDPGTALAAAESALASGADAAIGHASISKSLLRLSEPAKAMAHAESALAAAPLRPGTYYLLASAAAGAGEDEIRQEALEAFGLLREYGESAPEIKVERLQKLSGFNLWKSGPPPRLQLALAVALFEARRFEQGRLLAEQIPRVRHLSADHWVELGMAAQRRGQIVDARKAFDRALLIDPHQRSALTRRMVIALDLGELDQAESQLDQALALDTDYAPFVFLEARIALERGDEDRAVRRSSRAVELAPFVGRYRLFLADLHLARGDRQGFREVFADQVTKDPMLERYLDEHSHWLESGEH